jgi:hypothetical protein
MGIIKENNNADKELNTGLKRRKNLNPNHGRAVTNLIIL